MARITPHVFISAASDDLRSARQVVKNALLTIGCHPIVQEHFEPDYRTVKNMIKGRIEECHAVVHIIGKRYGGEPSPKSLPPGETRQSWTQLEYTLASQLGVKTYLFICDDAYPFDHREVPEPNDEVQLQEQYRQRILNGEQLYVVVKSPEELAMRISEMKLEAAELRKEVERSRNQLSEALESMEQRSTQLGEGQSQILAGLADLSVSFSGLAAQGGIIPEPVSPEQFYHNARMFELRGDYGNARRSYLGYFDFELDFLDPHLRFVRFLKIQEGREGARELYQHLAQKYQGSIIQLVIALLWDRLQRVPLMEQNLETHPDFGPAWYLLSLEFSMTKLGSQTLYDKKRERECLQTFQNLDSHGKVDRWILDKNEVNEWREDAQTRLAFLGQMNYAIDNPLTIYWMSHNTGWTGSIHISELVKEIFWKKPDENNFESTGFHSMRCYSTGNLQPQTNIELPSDQTRGIIEVKYTNLNDNEMGPFCVEFEPLEESVVQTKQILGVTKTGWVSFRLFDGKLLLYFTHLLSYRGGLNAIHFGLDSDTPTQKLNFPAYNKPGAAEIGDDVTIYIEVPLVTQFVSVQVIYKDDTQSGIRIFNNLES